MDQFEHDDAVNQQRRALLGIAAATVAVAQLGTIAPADAQTKSK